MRRLDEREVPAISSSTTMDIERERGITIKAHTVTLPSTGPRMERTVPPQPDRHPRPRGLLARGLALPERRARARCSVVDAARGSRPRPSPTPISPSMYDLEIIPVRQQDRPAGCGPRSRAPQEIEDVVGLDADRRPARLGQDRVRASTRCSRRSSTACRRRPGEADAPTRALVFDAWFDPYVGAVMLRAASWRGELRPREKHPLHDQVGSEREISQPGRSAHACRSSRCQGAGAPARWAYVIAGHQDPLRRR